MDKYVNGPPFIMMITGDSTTYPLLSMFFISYVPNEDKTDFEEAKVVVIKDEEDHEEGEKDFLSCPVYHETILVSDD
ncbi:hypothetical protein F441_12744 [Phytophthora nicotianae CJ01A1]|uniref:Uncharacterized protein n=2 Tax=Phytophthora nicotianae TaxID=4792 RepID=W2PXE6_PHYN3|nr:hypothetical protein PPTG_23481 [Phytophthora nicotianae INRA-310]ETN05633.1 hypothetical protein PPTG_23481 [Phytophthora nicotianae INRA-310]ETP11781.1 hypothetical protein F441_12744 [Phytophthora nicotianae CJ01A1]